MRIHYKPVCSVEDGLKAPEAPKYRQLLYKYSNHIVVLINIAALLSLYFIGIFTYMTEQDFSKFNYPKDVGDLRSFIGILDQYKIINEKDNLMIGINKINYDTITHALQEANPQYVRPLEQFRYYNFSIDIKHTCKNEWGIDKISSTLLPELTGKASHGNLDKITVIIIVKSAVNNYLRRHAIRNSWYLDRDIDYFRFKTVFIVGACHKTNRKPYSTPQYQYNNSWSVFDCQREIKEETEKFDDIIQSSAIDSYYNNTIKTFMTYKWITEHCPSDFILTLDDDYVFEVNNFIKYLEKIPQVKLPEFAQTFNESQLQTLTAQNLTLAIPKQSPQQKIYDRSSTIASLRNLSNQFLWSGFLRYYVRPIRVVMNKWYIKPEEYAYNKYPPFVTGGAVLMSFKTVKYFHYAAFFTNKFKFDDVYVGILAYKLKVHPVHEQEFFCNVDDYLAQNPLRPNTTNCIGVHDIEATKLLDLWEKRNQTALDDSIKPSNTTL